ncbi:MAG: hypothetical protein ACOX5H_00270 [Bacillus licheniformis]
MTINITLSPDYKLTSDERNIIVNERYFTDPTKAPNWPKRLAENPDLIRHQSHVGGRSRTSHPLIAQSCSSWIGGLNYRTPRRWKSSHELYGNFAGN